MKLDGVTPQGNSADRYERAKRAAKAGEGKSFADALKKAAAGGKPPPAPETSGPAVDPLEHIKEKLKAGFYNTKKIDDALSDKLSGYFDELA